ncbi:MAG: radical SAM protein [Pseudomonadota bacterium]
MDKYFIDGHKLYWHLDRVLQWQMGRMIPPVYIEVSPVSFCNHRCIFCGIDFARKGKYLLETDILCRRLKEMGTIGVKSIMLAGEGEPMLHNGLPTIIKTAKESEIDVSITTNGSVGNYEMWQEILPLLAWIRFSVDAGTAGIYAKVHNVSEESFHKTIRNISEAVKVKKESNIPIAIGVQFLIMPENYSTIEDALCLFSEIGIDYFSLKPYSLHPQMINKTDVTYTSEMMDHIEEIISRHKKSTKMSIIFRKESMGKYMNRNKMFKHCHALPFWGYISSKGDFYTCSVFLGDERFKTGNIYENDMGSILLGERRQMSIKHGEKDLLIEDECRLNCRMARINEFLEFLKDKPEHINFI